MYMNEILCINCEKYYKNINSFKEEHDNDIKYNAFKKPHYYIEAKNTLEYIFKLQKNYDLLKEELQKKDKIINELVKRIELVEELNNVFF